MTNAGRSRYLFWAVTPIGLIGLFFFYQRYVPLARSFQFALLPFLAAAFLLAAWDPRRGLLFVVMAIPLINNLPYFFGLHENVPHAPAALVLVLSYFLGWLVHHCYAGPPALPRHPVLKPLGLTILAVTASGIITFFRYANFFPFRTDRIYELTVNAMGVSAGGAIMSVIFALLNILTGLALFLSVLAVIRSWKDVTQLISALTAGTFVSILFGLYQHFGDLALGNHPISLRQGLVNGTFQDALGFGAFLSVVTPLLLAMAAAFRGPRRALAVLAFLGGLFVLPHTGSRSGLLSTALSLLLFFFLLTFRNRPERTFPLMAKARAARLTAVLLALAVLMVLLPVGRAVVFQRMGGASAPTLGKALEHRWDLLWRSAGTMIGQHPLAGIGVGAYVIERPNFEKLRGASFWYTDSAENYFLHQAAELGLIGLFLILWTLWPILKSAGQSFRRPIDDEGSLIRLGAACGLISHFLNILVHTFVGSVEVWYVFWLLAGVVYSQTEREGTPEGKRVSGGRQRLAAALLIVFYGGALLWSSTHSLSLPVRTDHLQIKQNFGLYPFERDPGRAFRWMGARAAVTVKASGPVAAIPLLASHPDLAQKPVKVKIYLVKGLFKDKRLLGEVKLEKSSWKTSTFDIREETGRDVTFLFEVSRTWNPRKALQSPDPRNLGAALGMIYFLQDKGAAEAVSNPRF